MVVLRVGRVSMFVYVCVCVNEKESGWKDKSILWLIAHNNQPAETFRSLHRGVCVCVFRQLCLNLLQHLNER